MIIVLPKNAFNVFKINKKYHTFESESAIMSSKKSYRTLLWAIMLQAYNNSENALFWQFYRLSFYVLFPMGESPTRNMWLRENMGSILYKIFQLFLMLTN